MIFFQKSVLSSLPKEQTPWVSRFAWLPVCVEERPDGKSKFVIFDYFETRQYKQGNDFWHEHRLPRSEISHRENADGRLGGVL